MKQIIFAIIILLSSNAIGQQGLSNNWIIGYQSYTSTPYFGCTRLNFLNGAPTVTYDSIGMDFNHTHTNISDSAGNMLFYTNGYYIADATDDTMDNGGGINPSTYTSYFYDGLGIPQANIILPKPNDSNLYYFIHSTVDKFPGYTCSYNLYLSIIDMSQNNGLGKVITKNQIIHTDSMQGGKISAVRHGNGRDWWIVTHGLGNDTYIKFLLTPYGLDGPFFQNIGTSLNHLGAGQALFSPDGNKYAYFWYQDGLEVLDFDRCSGQFSNPLNVPFIYEDGYMMGTAFSPNSNLLYVSNIWHLYQLDLTAANIAASKMIVATYDSFTSGAPGWPGFATVFGLSALAPDGKIYITTANGTLHMHIIDQPDSPGLACNVIQHGLQLPAFYFNTLPNHPNYFLGDNGLCNNLGIPPAPYKGVKKIQVFGNPTNDKFTLWFPVDKDVGWLEIYDVNGECIRREYVAQWSQYKTVDISNLSAGVYFCKMRWRSGEGSVSVVKIE